MTLYIYIFLSYNQDTCTYQIMMNTTSGLKKGRGWRSGREWGGLGRRGHIISLALLENIPPKCGDWGRMGGKGGGCSGWWLVLVAECGQGRARVRVWLRTRQAGSYPGWVWSAARVRLRWPPPVLPSPPQLPSGPPRSPVSSWSPILPYGSAERTYHQPRLSNYLHFGKNTVGKVTKSYMTLPN